VQAKRRREENRVNRSYRLVIKHRDTRNVEGVERSLRVCVQLMRKGKEHAREIRESLEHKGKHIGKEKIH
jgi:hypothetical protein